MLLRENPLTVAPQNAGKGRQSRTKIARRRILDAVVECLDQHGYSETTIKRVQAQAAVSRGALTHHFPSKEKMMAAVLEQLLEPVRDPVGRVIFRSHDADSTHDAVQSDLLRVWRQVVNTAEGRALVELLVASRTDERLAARIEDSLERYNHTIGDEIVKVYRSVNRDDDDVVMLWTLCRVVLRGLHLQERFDPDPANSERIMARFIELISPHLAVRQTPTTGTN